MLSVSEFAPLWWMKNPHLQTMFPAVFKAYLPLLPKYYIEAIELSDGDFVELVWPQHALDSKAPLVLILHGLGGGVNSSYVTILFNALKQAGFRSVLMQFRGGGEQTNRLAKMYNAGDTADLNQIVELLNQRESESLKAIIGVSLGGNLLLKWLGEMGALAKVNKAIAISVPYDLEGLVDHLDSRAVKFYQKRLLSELKRLYHKKADSDLIIKRDEIDKINSIKGFDHLLTAPLGGFKNVHDYYAQSSCLPHLKNISVNTLLIHANDDPFMLPTSIPNASDLSLSSRLELSPYGGHVGFVCAENQFKPGFWLAKRVPDFLMDLHCPI